MSEFQPPTEQDIKERPFFAPGERATHSHGVLYQGEYETPWDGTATAVRLHARALASTGVPVLLQSFSNVIINEHGIAEPVYAAGLDASVKKEIGSLRLTSVEKLLPLIKHLVVRDVTHLKHVLYPRGLAATDAALLLAMRESVSKATIFFTVWERDSISAELAQVLSRAAECWVPCEHNRAMLERAGVDRVHVIPHPYDPADPLVRLVERRPAKGKRFYAVGSWQPRKGLGHLLGAFLLAFSAKDDATLTLKITGGEWPDYDSPPETLRKWLATPGVQSNGWNLKTLAGKLRIVTGRFPRSQILKLHFDHNLYVSSSHGEAWNLPAFDAKVAGNRLVYVGYGGTADFAESSDVAVPFKLGPVHSSYHWEAEARWATYAVADLAAALRDVEPPSEFFRSAEFEAKFGLGAVGRKMLDRVIEVARGTSVEVARHYESLRDG